MDHQRIWTETQIAEWKQKNASRIGPGKDLSPEKLKELTESYMKKYVHRQMTAWEDFPEWEKISDEDIKEIIHWTSEKCFGGTEWHEKKNSESSDAARKAILRIYSYETPLYSALNRANQCQDRGAIKTLGPFSQLLHCITAHADKENIAVQEKRARVDEYGVKRITLYRGLGLPEKAIKGYYDYLSSQ